MTTNAGPEYFAAEKNYQDAKTSEMKLFYLKEMLKYAPKHKSSEKLISEIAKKISKLKHRIEKEKSLKTKKGSRKGLEVKKEGIGQIALIGLPNSGKSTLLKKLTGVETEIAAYAFTTKKPEKGMLDFQGAKIQIVEVPALIEGSSKGKAQGFQLLGIVRNADAVLCVVNSENALKEFKVLEKELNNSGIRLNEEKPKIAIKRSSFKATNISGKKFLKIPEKELKNFLKNYGIQHAEVVLEEEADLEKVAQALDEKIEYKKALIVYSRKSREKAEDLGKYLKGKIQVFSMNEEIEGKVFELLGKILVYTKKPGMEADLKEPIVVRKGSTVEEIARHLHKDFSNLKYARVWGSGKFLGQRVSKDYELKNKDIVEINV